MLENDFVQIVLFGGIILALVLFWSGSGKGGAIGLGIFLLLGLLGALNTCVYDPIMYNLSN